MIDNLTKELTSLRKRVAGVEDTEDITVGRLTMCLVDLRVTVEWLSSELREMKKGQDTSSSQHSPKQPREEHSSIAETAKP
jgi:hypothetical protein